MRRKTKVVKGASLPDEVQVELRQAFKKYGERAVLDETELGEVALFRAASGLTVYPTTHAQVVLGLRRLAKKEQANASE